MLGSIGLLVFLGFLLFIGFILFLGFLLSFLCLFLFFVGVFLVLLFFFFDLGSLSLLLFLVSLRSLFFRNWGGRRIETFSLELFENFLHNVSIGLWLLSGGEESQSLLDLILQLLSNFVGRDESELIESGSESAFVSKISGDSSLIFH